jgi:hypothetical protein
LRSPRSPWPGDKGRFEDVVDVGNPLSQDRKRQAKHEARKRGLIDTGTDKRYVRRDGIVELQA